MGATFLVWGVVLLVGAAVLWVLLGLSGAALPIGGKGGRPGGPTVRYRVPEGQDPAVVATAVSEHGYEARMDEEGGMGERYVVVACPRGDADREPVRAAIAAAGTSMDDPAPARREVRFVDER
ncbi:MAG TPA: hypothetical protein VNS55_06370 [Nocardioides sp.]|nr:hypothetical protein [Nocardioides sp.]